MPAGNVVSITGTTTTAARSYRSRNATGSNARRTTCDRPLRRVPPACVRRERTAVGDDQPRRRRQGSEQRLVVAVLAAGRHHEVGFLRCADRRPERGVDPVRHDAQTSRQERRACGAAVATGSENGPGSRSIPRAGPQRPEHEALGRRVEMVADDDVPDVDAQLRQRERERDADVLAVRQHDVVVADLPSAGSHVRQRSADRTADAARCQAAPVEEVDAVRLLQPQELRDGTDSSVDGVAKRRVGAGRHQHERAHVKPCAGER